MSEHSVEVASFDMAEEAHLARIRLAQHGIPAFVSDESIGPMMVLPGLGGFKVRVRASDHERALALLEGPTEGEAIDEAQPEGESDSGEASDPEAVPVPDIESEAEFLEAAPPPADPARPPCPACGSKDVSTEKYLAPFEWLLFGILSIAAPKKRWVCLDCGKRWKPVSEGEDPY